MRATRSPSDGEPARRRFVRPRPIKMIPMCSTGPRFSIITCTYNSEKYLQECLDSVTLQSFRDYEHIIVHASSSDNTRTILGKYKDVSPESDIRIVETEPRGIANAMNIGIDNAKGEYVHFLHSDDWYFSGNTLSYVNGLIEHTHKEILVGHETIQFGKFKYFFRPIKNRSNQDLLSMQKFGNFVSHTSLFMTKRLFDTNGKFDETYQIAMDYDLWFRLLSEDNFLIYEQPTVVFRRHFDSTSFKPTNLYKLIKETRAIKRKYLD